MVPVPGQVGDFGAERGEVQCPCRSHRRDQGHVAALPHGSLFQKYEPNGNPRRSYRPIVDRVALIFLGLMETLAGHIVAASWLVLFRFRGGN